MFAHLIYLFALIATTVAIPLNSRGISSVTTRNHCKAALALLEDDANDNITEVDSTPPFMMKRSKLSKCGTPELQPAVRFSAYPNTGITWAQYLIEEATKVATQNPTSIPTTDGGPFLYPAEEVNCRAECGAQIFLHPTCTAGSLDANNVTIANGTDPEIFKNHYPDYARGTALFETYNPIQKTILLTRNPLDTYMGQFRHSNADSISKVGSPLPDFDDLSRFNNAFNASEGCSPGFTLMREDTSGRGIDPLNICFDNPIEADTFEKFIPLWCGFFRFWLNHSSVECNDVTVVRYEDFGNRTGYVLKTILREAGFSTVQSEDIQRAVAAFGPSEDRLSYNVWFNKTFYANETIKRWANFAINECRDYVEDFDYGPFLHEVAGKVYDPMLPPS